MAFNPLHLNHLQQVRCCWCKVKNSESKSQLFLLQFVGVLSCCWCKVKNSESKSQLRYVDYLDHKCCCWCKVKNSESKSQRGVWSCKLPVCCCWCKVKNSESKSQLLYFADLLKKVVAGVKLKILKANHNSYIGVQLGVLLLLV